MDAKNPRYIETSSFSGPLADVLANAVPGVMDAVTAQAATLPPREALAYIAAVEAQLAVLAAYKMDIEMRLSQLLANDPTRPGESADERTARRQRLEERLVSIQALIVPAQPDKAPHLAALPLDPVPSIVPVALSAPHEPTITDVQLRIGLARAGITEDQIDAVIAGIPNDAARYEASVRWERATTIRRSHPLVAAIGAALQLTGRQLDEMFAAFAEIPS
ncbi:MAG TPA: hypothetical protein VF614_16695 [Chthoniobacteraceae bacterium]|jgi:hypothetical protein